MDCSDLLDRIDSNVAAMDSELGWRVSGAAISGARVPTFKDYPSDGKGPQWFTETFLVASILDSFGLADTRSGDWTPESMLRGRLAVATQAMNRPLGDAEQKALRAMSENGSAGAVATDGFVWTVMIRRGSGAVVTRHDLRPYYVEALERRRFRDAVERDRRGAMRFASVIGRIAGESHPREHGQTGPGMNRQHRLTNRWERW